jgi:hypothetical protein
MLEILGDAFPFIGAMLSGAGLMIIGYTICKCPEDILSLPWRILIFTISFFIGLSIVSITILKYL